MGWGEKPGFMALLNGTLESKKKSKPFIILSEDKQLCVSATANAAENQSSGVMGEGTENAHLNLPV